MQEHKLSMSLPDGQIPEFMTAVFALEQPGMISLGPI
jgi:hypothetical protein